MSKQTPHAKTIAAMRDARDGKVQSFETVEELMEDLNAPEVNEPDDSSEPTSENIERKSEYPQ